MGVVGYKCLGYTEPGLILKGFWWMPWYQEAMKEAEDCHKLRGAVNQALIRRFPNGGTHLGKNKVFLSEFIG